MLLNNDTIVSCLTNTVTRDDGTVETVTTIHIPPHGTWEVQETVEEVYNLANGGGCSGKCSSLLQEEAAPVKKKKKA